MNIGITSLIANVPSMTCFTIAGIMACNRVDGWGWLVFAGVLVAKSVETTKSKEGPDEPDKDPAPTPPRPIFHRN